MARGDSGLFNSGVFARTDVPSTRQAVRDKLFTQILDRFGGDSNITRGAATAGALLGGGLNRLFGGGQDPRVARQAAIQRVQQKVAETGLDPSNPQFFDVTAKLFEEEGLPDLAQRTRLQGFQVQSQKPQPEPLESAITVTGGTPQGDAFLKRFPNQALREGETFSFPVAVDPQTGRMRVSGQPKRLGTGQNISITTGGGPQFSAAQEGRIAKLSGRADTASQQLPLLSELANLATQEDVKQGAIQPLVTRAQGIAQSLGIDAQNIANRIGLGEIGNLGKKEEFDRLAKTLVIEGFENFKGNLNQKEVQLAQDAFAGLGRSREGNLRAIAALQASAQLAQETGNQALFANTPAELAQIVRNKNNRDVKQFQNLLEQNLEQLRSETESEGGSGQETEDRNITEIDINAAQSALREGEQLGNFDASAGPTGAWPILDSNGNLTGEFIVPESTGGQ